MLWEHKLRASVSTAFSVLLNFHKCFYHSKETENMFSISLRKHCEEKKENNLLNLIIKCKFSLLGPSIHQQLIPLVLCFYQVIET